MTGSTAPLARQAYDALAPSYDDLTADYDYERWLDTLEGLAREHGLSGHRLLDVACGTGRSFEPLLRRGYDVTACDLSPAMARRAARRLGGATGRVTVADMRQLPSYGEFDLITCLDDAVNYLLETSDLDRAFAGAAANLRPGGIYAFDVNALHVFRSDFAASYTHEAGGVTFFWHGLGSADAAANSVSTGRYEIRAPGAPPRVSVHTQRHWPVDVVADRLSGAGLEPVAILGQSPGVVMSEVPDEAVHTKVMFLARMPARGARGGTVGPSGHPRTRERGSEMRFRP
jgi:SAM-dependent methyltransferase